jgi:hypothetical protein
MSVEANLTITIQNRKALKRIMDSLNVDQINHIPAGFNNNILWNCAHVIAVQQMLTYGLTNQPFTVEKEFVFKFAPGTKPDEFYTEAFINEIKSMLFTSIEQLEIDIKTESFFAFNPFLTALKFEINDLEKAVAFNQYHEALHMGHILNIRKFL